MPSRLRLEAAGVEVISITDHHSSVSIYFFDANGIRHELTVPTASALEMQRLAGVAQAELKHWPSAQSARRAAVAAAST